MLIIKLKLIISFKQMESTYYRWGTNDLTDKKVLRLQYIFKGTGLVISITLGTLTAIMCYHDRFYYSDCD
jgi:hypothetical protein